MAERAGELPLSTDRARRRSLVARVFEVLRPVLPLAWLTVAALVLSTLLTLAGPFFLRYAIDHGLRATPPDLGIVRRASLCFLATASSSFLLARLHVRLTGRLGERFVRDMRRLVFAHMTQMSTRYFDRQPSGRLVARLTSDIDTLQDLVQFGLAQFVQSALTLSVLSIVLVSLSWKLTLVCLLPIPALVYASRAFQRRSRAAYLVVRERVGQSLSTLVESLAGIRVVQAYAQQDARRERSLRENAAHGEASVRAAAVQAQFLPVLELTTATSSVLALAAGGYLALEGRETIGTVTAFCVYLLMAFEPLQMLSMLFNTLQSAAASLEKLFAVVDEPLDIAAGVEELPRRAALTLEHVTFSHERELAPVLQDVSLTIPHGERLAIVGATGAGKSTLAKLLARLLDPTRGKVRYGAQDLRQAQPESLRRRIVMVAQEGHIFAGSVADNLRIVRPEAGERELREALERIGAYQRFASLPLGLDAPVGTRGALLSAGERQLLTLARVALLDADVVIFDEATSSLDTGTERVVTEALELLTAGRTVVIIAHRLSTLNTVDRVALLADAGIAELGSPGELLAKNGLYAALYRQWQLSAQLAEP
jgi:ATP-binding cassette, subfamily B, bacterial